MVGGVLVWIQDLPEGERIIDECRTRAYNSGLGSDPPVGSRGRALGGGQRAKPLKLKALCPFSYKKGLIDFKDLSDSSYPCLR